MVNLNANQFWSNVSAVNKSNVETIMNKTMKADLLFSDLSDFVGERNGHTAYLGGGSALDDGQQGIFRWDADSTAAESNDVIRPSSIAIGDPGRWERAPLMKNYGSDVASEEARISALEVYRNALTISFDLDILIDVTGVTNSGIGCFYVPRGVYRARTNQTTQNKNYAASDALFTDYIKVAFATPAATHHKIYIDFTDDVNPYKCVSGGANITTPVGENYEDILEIKTQSAQIGVQSRFSWRRIDYGNAGIVFRGNICVEDDGKILLPVFTIYARGSVKTITPSDGSAFFEQSWDNTHSGFGNRLVLSVAHALKSSPVQSEFFLELSHNQSGQPKQGSSDDYIEIYNSYRGSLNSSFTINRNVPNDAPFMNDLAEYQDEVKLFGNAALVDITDSDANALGFTKGVHEPDSNPRPYYGYRLPQPRHNFCAFVSIYVLDTGEGYGVPRVYLERGDENEYTNSSPADSLVSGNMQFLEQIGTNVRRYAQWVEANVNRYSNLDYDNPVYGIRAGVEGASGYSTSPVIFGLQIGIGADLFLYVKKKDYINPKHHIGSRLNRIEEIVPVNSEPKLIYPPDLHLIDGRRQYIDSINLLENKSEYGGGTILLAGRSAINGQVVLRQGDVLEINPTDFMAGNSTAELIMRPKRRSDGEVQRVLLNIKRIASLSGRQARLLMLGDSHIELTGWVNGVYQRLNTLSLTTLEMIGTVACTDDYDSGQPTALGEGRGDREWADYIYANTNAVSPVPKDGEATYQAYDTITKRAWNPFLADPVTAANNTGNFAVPGGNNADTRNGYRFSLQYYLNRFGFNTPTHIILELGTNDIAQAGSNYLSQQTAALDIIYRSIRDVSNDIHIGVVQSADGWDSVNNQRWDERVALIRQAMNYINAQGDPCFTLLPVYAHLSHLSGFGYGTGSADADTGVVTTNMSDPRHPGKIGKELASEVIAAWVANTAPLST